MKWMNTKELVSLLKRFPNEEVEVVDYQDGSLASALFGMKADGEKCFRLTWGRGDKNLLRSRGASLLRQQILENRVLAFLAK